MGLFFRGAFLSLGALVVGFLFFMVLFLFYHAAPAVREIGFSKFFLSDLWFPVDGDFGLLGALFGSLALAILSSFWAVPVACLTAVFIQFYLPLFLQPFFKGALELMAGIPSVVYGIFGLTVVVPLMSERLPPGPSVFVGVLILGLMILPSVALMVYQGLLALPKEHILGVKALDLAHSKALFYVYAPFLWPTVFVSAILAFARALGETMVVLMVCGNIPGMPESFFSPVRTLTANIALEMAYARKTHKEALFFSGALLVIATLLLVGSAFWARKKAAFYVG